MTDPDGRGIETASITITKYFDETTPGGFTVYAEFSEPLTLVDALGMLSFTQLTAFQQFVDARDGDDA